MRACSPFCEIPFYQIQFVAIKLLVKFHFYEKFSCTYVLLTSPLIFFPFTEDKSVDLTHHGKKAAVRRGWREMASLPGLSAWLSLACLSGHSEQRSWSSGPPDHNQSDHNPLTLVRPSLKTNSMPKCAGLVVDVLLPHRVACCTGMF